MSHLDFDRFCGLGFFHMLIYASAETLAVQSLWDVEICSLLISTACLSISG